jgi:hypothetical protein
MSDINKFIALCDDMMIIDDSSDIATEGVLLKIGAVILGLHVAVIASLGIVAGVALFTRNIKEIKNGTRETTKINREVISNMSPVKFREAMTKINDVMGGTTTKVELPKGIYDAIINQIKVYENPTLELCKYITEINTKDHETYKNNNLKKYCYGKPDRKRDTTVLRSIESMSNQYKEYSNHIKEKYQIPTIKFKSINKSEKIQVPGSEIIKIINSVNQFMLPYQKINKVLNDTYIAFDDWWEGYIDEINLYYTEDETEWFNNIKAPVIAYANYINTVYSTTYTAMNQINTYIIDILAILKYTKIKK